MMLRSIVTPQAMTGSSYQTTIDLTASFYTGIRQGIRITGRKETTSH